MAARDLFHQAVRSALQKEGWNITHDPFPLPFGGVEMYIDLGAERLLAAERQGERIAVEIKSFLGSSVITEFHSALGQFLNYRLVLSDRDPERKLYLAVPIDTYSTFFALPFSQRVIQHHHLLILVYHAAREEIVQWID